MVTLGCAGPASNILRAVSSGRTELRVELQRGEVPITGDLIDASGERLPFAGWAQLVALIERASSGSTAPTGTDGSTPPDQLSRRKP